MLFRITKLVTGLAIAGGLIFGQAQKNWKDRGEYELVAEQIAKAADPAKKLELLNQWKAKYPATDFSWERLGQFLVTYQQLGKAAEMLGVAKEMSAADPKNFTGPYYVVLLLQSMQSQDPGVLADGEKAANTLLSGLDEFFAADKKPQGAADDAWLKQKEDARLKALNALIYVSTVKKDWPQVEVRVSNLIKHNPANAQASYQLGTAILTQRKVERQAQAIYHFARACGMSGEGALPAAQKQQVCDYFGRIYPQYRGDKSGMEELKAQAVSNPFPPQDFAIKTKQQEQFEQLEKLKETNPQLAIWVQLKQALAGADGASYFASSLKDAALPKLKGKVVSHEPATNPKKIVVGITDASAPEITIEIEDKAFLPGKADPGTEIEFESVGKDFTAEPFNLTVLADKDAISGWPGKAAGPAPARKAPVRKKK